MRRPILILILLSLSSSWLHLANAQSLSEHISIPLRHQDAKDSHGEKSRTDRNPGVLSSWRFGSLHDFQTAPQSAAPPELRVSVPSAARVTVPHEALLAQGWTNDTLPSLRVRCHDRLIASTLDARGLHFTAEANDSPYSSSAVYWLGQLNPDIAAQSAYVAANSQILSWAPDTVYSSLAHAQQDDGWFAAELTHESEPLQISLDVPTALEAGSALELRLAALVNTPHRLLIALNGSLLEPLSWQSDLLKTHSYVIKTQQALPAGSLTIELLLASGEDDTVLLEGISLPDLLLPLPELSISKLEPAQSIPSNLADTLIIAASPLLPALQPLVEAHEAPGQRVALMSVQAAYDRYSFGERNPEAIRSLIRNWQPRPERVILVGDGTLRMRNIQEDPDLSIPPYIVNADPKNGAVPCDTCYVRLDTDNPLDDPMPDLAIGRLPVHSLSETEVVVEKTVAALIQTTAGSWGKQALLLADNDQDELGNPDPAGPFRPLVEQANTLLPDMHIHNFMYRPGQSSTTSYYATAAELRSELFPAWNAGAGLLLYIGHASPWQWAWTSAQEATPQLFNIYDADLLNNGRRLPILVSLSCQSGNSFHPALESSDERLLLHAEGGIIASLSPAGSAITRGHSTLSAGLLPALTSNASLGAAHLAAIRSLIESGQDLDLAFSYQILGDPDLRLPQARDVAVYLPGVQR